MVFALALALAPSSSIYDADTARDPSPVVAAPAGQRLPPAAPVVTKKEDENPCVLLTDDAGTVIATDDTGTMLADDCDCRPFTIGQSAIGGCDPIGR